jgi:hypothetical protein
MKWPQDGHCGTNAFAGMVAKSRGKKIECLVPDILDGDVDLRDRDRFDALQNLVWPESGVKGMPGAVAFTFDEFSRLGR